MSARGRASAALAYAIRLPWAGTLEVAEGSSLTAQGPQLEQS